VDTGHSRLDAGYDFSRARRAHILSDLGRWLRREPDDVALILPFEEVVEALGRTGERERGLQIIKLDAIVGTVDRTQDFDRSFRPLTTRSRMRWERIAAASRRGESLPPISVYEISGLYFVRDGHHRVSVARSLGRTDIDAYVTEVLTRVRPGGDIKLSDLPLKDHERLFRERVPLAREQRAQVRPSDPWDYAVLAEAVEAWGFRAMQARRDYLDRGEVADLWFQQEYLPVVELLREAGFVGGDETETDAYLRISHMRYDLLRTHEWSDEVLAELRDADRRRRRRRRPVRPVARRRRYTG
jgi:hypothetical protein